VREFEDVAAVVDAVAETAGSPVDLLGHSFGGFCAFGAATLTSNKRYAMWVERNNSWLVVTFDENAGGRVTPYPRSLSVRESGPGVTSSG
jgi:dipeptidyl aminopeptidase/acylaminoacyl peptidase